MTRDSDMAKAMCQHFMDARLIENTADLGSNLFKDRGTYVLMPEGLHVLEQFISKNGMNSDHLQPVFASQPICINLLHLERRSADDEIVIVTQSVITALFRRFVGRLPNYPTQLSTNPSASSTSTMTSHSTGTSKGQIHVKLISARGLAVTSVRSRPYVIVQFEQNEFVSREPTDEMDEEVTNATFRLIALGFMLANK